MTFRLARIQTAMLVLTASLAGAALVSGVTLPFGVVLGGAAAWLDFVVIKSLATAMLVRLPSPGHVLPMAVTKSLVLVAVPAAALFLPATLVDGVSFALGVTTLPLAVVVDALRAIPEPKTGAA
jgi:hypothetical protein